MIEVMPLIAAKRAVTNGPRVNVSAPATSRQIRVAFTRALVEKAGLAEVTHLAIDHDEAKKKLRFIPAEAEYGGVPAHKLLSDGGKKTAARIVLIARTKLGFLPPASYEPQAIRRGKGFEIYYGGAK